MKTRHARTIAPFHYSGVNPRPQSADPGDAPEGHTVSLGTPGGSRRAQARADAAQGVTYSDPPRVPVGSAVVAVHLDGQRVRVPVDWGVALSSARGRDALILREPNAALHVLVIDPDGKLRELAGIPADLVADLAAKHFPRAGR